MKIEGTVTKGGVAVQGAKVSLFRQGLRQTLVNGSITQLDTGVDTYIAPWHARTLVTSLTGPNSRVIAISGVLTDLKITLDAQPGEGRSYTFVMYLNGNPTNMSVTISGTNTTGEDITHSIQVVTGDILYLKSTPSGTPAAARIRNSLVFLSTSNTDFIMGAGNTLSGTATINIPIDGGGTSSGMGAMMISAIAGTLQNFRVKLGTAPGTGLTRTITIYNQSGASTIVVTISDANTTGTDLVHTLAVAAGDQLYVKSEVSASLAASEVYFTIEFVSSVASQYTIGGSCSSNLSGTSTQYMYTDSTTTQSSDQHFFEQRYTKDLTIKKMYVGLSVAPGSGGSGKKRTFTLMKNGVATALTVDVLETATDANVVADVTIAEGDLLELEMIPTSSPAAALGRWGFLVVTSSTELIEAQLTDSSGNYSFTSLADIEHGYHTTVEFEDGNGKYNAKSLPFLDPVAE
jgi:hypothetical protein